jgi:hypothetical protein
MGRLVDKPERLGLSSGVILLEGLSDAHEPVGLVLADLQREAVTAAAQLLEQYLFSAVAVGAKKKTATALGERANNESRARYLLTARQAVEDGRQAARSYVAQGVQAWSAFLAPQR